MHCEHLARDTQESYTSVEGRNMSLSQIAVHIITVVKCPAEAASKFDVVIFFLSVHVCFL